ncbi:MAG: TolC family protein [Saprospiraceae bacterium]|nr:TolC family protein [Saprospiraceae bacterium]
MQRIKISWFQILSICCVCITSTHGQIDSTILTYREFMDNVIRFHPLSRKADLKSRMAEAEWLSARGNLDPVITSGWNEKNFDDKLYYRQFQGKLQIPISRFGVDFVTGYENSDGTFLNPEYSTGTNGLWNAGVEVDVLQGLIVNERRIALDQARIFQDLAENERQIMLNQLLYEASIQYLQWQQFDAFRITLIENLELAINYLENTKQSFLNGEKTAMDTLEANILFQDASISLQKNEALLLKARQQLENFLWFNDMPVTLQPDTQPETSGNGLFVQSINLDNERAVVNNPIILAADNKITQNEIEQRLKREKLKPKFKIKYNPLLATSDAGLSPTFSAADFKWGFDFSFPLLLRSERADVQRGAIKIQELVLDRENKRNELENKLDATLQQQEILAGQLQLLQENVAGYRLLLEGENEKFRLGESSVFLLNKRQEKYIDGQLKLIELRLKLERERLNYLYYSNQLLIK